MPFDDVSGDRLRDWLGIERDVFYDPSRIAILPMAFCFPGSGTGGDLPPPPICAETWRTRLLALLPDIGLTVLLGRYALDWHLPDADGPLTETVAGWRRHWPSVLPLPHPSPRNGAWFKRNPWFEAEVLPALRARVAELLR